MGLILQNLKNQIKRRVGNSRWDYVESITRPKIVNVMYAQVSDSVFLVQITVKIHSKQVHYALGGRDWESIWRTNRRLNVAIDCFR
jgi:hypothetical protein